MKPTVFFLLFIIYFSCYSQSFNTEQASLNFYIDFANDTKKSGASVANSLIEEYRNVRSFRNGNRNMFFKYTCPIQEENYYYQKAREGKGINNTDKTKLNSIIDQLKKKTDTLEAVCKGMEVYFRLEDYKRDDFKSYEQLLEHLIILLKDMKSLEQKTGDLARETYLKTHPHTSSNPYQAAEDLMRKTLEEQEHLLDSWFYNLNESIHTGMPSEAISKSITTTEKLLADLKNHKSNVGNYSQTVINQFIEGLEEFQSTKRRAIDDYNFEAKKSDKHSNEVYLDLINLYNGMLVADFNNFIQLSAGQHSYYSIKAAEYLPMIGVREQALKAETSVAPFQDIPYTSITVSTQTTAIPLSLNKVLNDYIDFINESLRQTENLHLVVMNLNGSAVYYKDLTTYQGRGKLYVDPSGYKIPLSAFQKISDGSTAIPSSYRKSLLNQAQVLMNMMKEMEGLSIELNKQASDKLYEQDNLARMYEIFERFKVLFKVFDEKKEVLYNDLRRIHESYKTADPASSWNVSAKELLKLADLDKEALFKAKAYYQGDTSTRPSTGAIREQIRNVISKEFSNMKGIQKYGRSNGLCPYTPYEDIPENSSTFCDDVDKLRSPKAYGYYSHPYHDLIYLYNVIVDDYNDFCELSKKPFLKNITQPELFSVRYPDQKIREFNEQSERIRKENEERKNAKAKNSSAIQQSGERTIHDTVYIEKHRVDTVYIREKADNEFSLEGYAANNMVLLLDVSGSMNEPEKLPLMKQSLKRLLEIMRKEDELAIVVYSGEAYLALPPTSCKEHDKIIKAVESLKSEGSTNVNAGIRLAYKVADKNYIRGGNNRIILATDGEFTVNKEAENTIEKYASEEITLSIFYFAQGNHESEKLKVLTAQGKGNYAAITPQNSDLRLLKEAKGKKK